MLSPKEAVQILLAPLQEGNICKTTPRAIQHNVTFLVDRKHIRHEDDIKSDDMGAWRNNGVHKYDLPWTKRVICISLTKMTYRCQTGPYIV